MKEKREEELMDRDRGLGTSRVQKGGDNGAPQNEKPETLRPRPGTPIAEARERAGEGNTLDPRDRREEVLKRFDARATGESQGISMARLRIAAKQMAGVVDDEVVPSRERFVALRKLEEVLFWANAGVARNGPRDGMPA